MRILNYSSGSDTGGVSIATKEAFDRYAPDWDYHAMNASNNYIDFPVDVPWSQLELERLYDAADVVHISNTLHAHDWYDNGQGKPTVFMHHGWLHQDYPARVREVAEVGCVQVGSTLDLSIIAPEVEWVPRYIDIEQMAAIRKAHYRPGKVIRIGHSPTDRVIKGSDAFDAAIVALRKSGLPVEAVVMQNMTWAECLAVKATCDVLWDQPDLGYGTTALEGWSMGMPVLVGVSRPEVREGMLAYWGQLPFMEANRETLEQALRAIVADADLRAEYARRGMEHVRRWHDGRVTVERLQRLYRGAPRTTPGGSGKRLAPATLAKIKRHALRDAQIAKRMQRRLVRA